MTFYKQERAPFQQLALDQAQLKTQDPFKQELKDFESEFTYNKRNFDFNDELLSTDDG